MLCGRCDDMAERNARITVLAVSLARQLHDLAHASDVPWFRCGENVCRRAAQLTGRTPGTAAQAAGPGGRAQS
jgi:hypothetical protein